MNNPRYDGKPMLRLLECYVLKSIGALTLEQERQLNEMESGLRKTFESSGTWDKMIAEQMGFSPELPAYLVDLWRQNLSASGDQTRLPPDHFAQHVVDSNFGHLL
jgi:hypothetical protein